MKNIMVATDFSENAKHAFNTAVVLAKQKKATLHVFHTFQLQTYYANMPMNMAGDMTAQLKQEADDEMKKLTKNLPASLKFKTFICEGYLVPELQSYIEKENIDLLVIGAGGNSKLQYAFLGSMANQVIEKIKCMTLAIPPAFEYKEFSTVLYASDLQGDEFSTLVTFSEFAKLFNAELIVLHIKTSNEPQQINTTKLMSSVRLQTDYPKIKLEEKYYPDTLEGINEYMDIIRPDLFAMAIHDRSFFQKMFHTSLTKKMAHLSKVPLLILHKQMIVEKSLSDYIL